MKKFLAVLLFFLAGSVAVRAQSVTLNWGASPVATGHSAATSYQVWRGTVSKGETLLTTAGTGGNVGLALTFTDTTVVAGTTYFYEVFALNASGPSGPSNEATAVVPATPPAGGPPSPPTITITITLPSTT
jgi:hypothetical protein